MWSNPRAGAAVDSGEMNLGDVKKETVIGNACGGKPGIPHHSLLPHIPLVHLSEVNSSPRPGIAPQSLNSSSSHCHFQESSVPARSVYGCARTVRFSFHLGCHRSAVSLSALNVSILTQTIAWLWGSHPCFSSPTFQGQAQSY